MAAARCTLSGKKTCKQLEARVATARAALTPEATWNSQEYIKALDGLRDGLTDSPDHRPSHCVAHGLVAVLCDIGRKATDMFDNGNLTLKDFAVWFNTVLALFQSRSGPRSTTVTPTELPPAIEAGIMRVTIEAGRALCDRLHEDYQVAWDVTELVKTMIRVTMPRGHSEADIRAAVSFVSEMLKAPLFVRFHTSRFAESTGKYTPTQICEMAVIVSDLAPAHSKERYKLTHAMVDAGKRCPPPTFQFDTCLIAVFQTTCGSQNYTADGRQYSELPIEFLNESTFNLVARSTPQALTMAIESALVISVFMAKNLQRNQKPDAEKPFNIPGKHGLPILKAILDKHPDLDRLSPASERHGNPIFSGTLGLLSQFLGHVHEKTEYVTIFSRPKVVSFLSRYVQQFIQGHLVANWIASCPAVMERYLQLGQAQFVLQNAADFLVIDEGIFHHGRPLLAALVHTAAKLETARSPYKPVLDSENFWIAIDDVPTHVPLIHCCAFLCQFPEALPFIAQYEDALRIVLDRATTAFDKDGGKLIAQVAEPILYCFLALAVSKPKGWSFSEKSVRAMNTLGHKLQQPQGVHALEVLNAYVLVAYWTQVRFDLIEWRDEQVKGPFGAIMQLIYYETEPTSAARSAGAPMPLAANEHCCLAVWMTLDRFPGLLLEYDNKFHKNVGGENLRKELLTYAGRVESQLGAEWAVAKEATGEIRRLLTKLRW